jgi:hypothetical protein
MFFPSGTRGRKQRLLKNFRPIWNVVRRCTLGPVLHGELGRFKGLFISAFCSSWAGMRDVPFSGCHVDAVRWISLAWAHESGSLAAYSVSWESAACAKLGKVQNNFAIMMLVSCLAFSRDVAAWANLETWRIISQHADCFLVHLALSCPEERCWICLSLSWL